LLLTLMLAACSQTHDERNETDDKVEYVVVYTSMDQSRTAPVFQAFTAESGVRIQQVSADNDRLLELIPDKTHKPAADLFMADGVAALWRAADKDLFRPTYSADLDAAIPADLRDPDARWAGLALRAKALIVHSPSVAGDAYPVAYESLAEPQWRGRVCLSSSSQAENIALIALLIERHGTRDAELIVRRLVANLALPVFDAAQSMITAFESGRCGAGIAGLDAVIGEGSDIASAQIRVVTPLASGGGTLVDIIGAGVTRHAANPEGARRLLFWLASPAGQSVLSEHCSSLPVNASVAAPRQLRVWSSLDRAGISVFRLGVLNQDAIDLAERAHYP
jgi:iron(III) transport system substrate-binding protein